MARLVRHTATGPYKITPQEFPPDGKSIFICGCGLSQRMPYCDGTHKTACPAEAVGTLYVYDVERKAVVETRDDASQQ